MKRYDWNPRKHTEKKNTETQEVQEVLFGRLGFILDITVYKQVYIIHISCVSLFFFLYLFLFIYIYIIVHMLFCFSNMFSPTNPARKKTHLFVVSSKQTRSLRQTRPPWYGRPTLGRFRSCCFFSGDKKMGHFCFRVRVERSLSTQDTMDVSILGT